MKRTNYCGALRERDLDKQATVMGWVATKRDMGGIIFIDLRDREGTLQVVFDLKNLSEADFHTAEGLKNESVIAVTGRVRIRDEETYNPRLETGTIELAAEKLEVLSAAKQLPFSLEDAKGVREDLRLKYRFLDLRRKEMFSNLKFRHDLVRVTENYLDSQGFLSVETPMLTKSTPEGARDYLVPSRVHQGKFYALPQSPQIFKQLLMVGGIDKYYQVARCFRDEDLRADRQPEFTQVDMELSFVDQEDILQFLEGLFKHIMQEQMGIAIREPFLRLTWTQAMDVYGSDKPDLRFGLPIVDVTEVARKSNFSVFQSVIQKKGIVRAINVVGKADFTRSEIEHLTEKAQSYGAKGMAWIAYKEDGEIYSILTKYFSEAVMQELLDRMQAKPGDFILFCADKLSTVRRTLGGLRLDLAKMLHLQDKTEYKFLFVTDFPQFEYSEEEGRYISTHHPFTMPYPEDVEYLLSDPARVRAQAYDVVLNGIELGSGSIRIHRQDVQEKMFRALGFTDEQIESRFGFMTNAFSYGTPPHGGFAFGLDRLAMQLLGAESLREVIAFPKLKDASCPLTDAPNVVDPEQLEALGLFNPDLFGQGEAGEAGRAIQRAASPQIDVDHVANLAKLYLRPEEKAEMAKDLQKIVAFANQLSEIDTQNVPQTAHVVPQENVFRADEVAPGMDREAVLQNAPAQDDGYFFVPQVVE